MYVSEKSYKRPEVAGFMQYVMDNYEVISEASFIVPMSTEQADKAKQAL